jgi:8-oxo-dGTP pyrophosphatase MutT (NUDIX family)
MKRRIVRTVMSMLTYEREILLLFHDKCFSWMGPGGKIESDELVFEAAVRELKEEAGIDLAWTHDMLRPYPTDLNQRVRQCPQPMCVLTYIGFEGSAEFDLLEDQVFWWEVPDTVRNQPLIANEGHDVRWFNIADVIRMAQSGEMEIQPEVLGVIKEIASHPLKATSVR